jgi:integrase
MPWGKENFPVCVSAARLPVVLDPEEVTRFFDFVPSLKYRAALMLCYGAGLRISEAVAVKVTDIDSKRMAIRVEEGKGRKDRYVMLSPRLLAALRRYYRRHPARRSRRPARRMAVPFLARKPASYGHLAVERLPGRFQTKRPHQTRHLPHSEAQLRHSPARKRYRHAGHSDAPRPRPNRHHGALHKGFGRADSRTQNPLDALGPKPVQKRRK